MSRTSFFSFIYRCRFKLLILSLFFLGLAHEVIDISSDSADSDTESEHRLLRTLLERRRERNRPAESFSSRMSATSPASDDSNAERDYEYAAAGYITEPEIVFTPETESEDEPRMGHEAES